MSISSISSLSYSPSYQLMIDSEYQRIRSYLLARGYRPSGDKAVDEQTYNMLVSRELLADKLESTVDSSKTRASDNSSEARDIPWADFMRKVGLDATGDIDEDKTKTIAELEKRIRNASGDSEREYYTGLLGQVNSEFNKPVSSPSGVMDFSGASSIISDLNRVLLVHSRSI